MDDLLIACAPAVFIIMPGGFHLLVHVLHLEPALAIGIPLQGCLSRCVEQYWQRRISVTVMWHFMGRWPCASTVLAAASDSPFLMKLTRQGIQIDTVGWPEISRSWPSVPVALGCLPQLRVQQERMFLPSSRSCRAMSIYLSGTDCRRWSVLCTMILWCRGFGLFIWTFTAVFVTTSHWGYLLVGWPGRILVSM